MALKILYLGGHASLGIDGYVPVPAWNEFDKDADVVLSNSNRTATITATDQGAIRALTARDASGHHYFELLINASDGRVMCGIGQASASLANYPGGDGNGRGYWGNSGQKYISGSGSFYGATFTSTDVIGVELKAGDLIFWRKIGGSELPMTSQGVAFSGLTGLWFPMLGTDTSVAGSRGGTINTGQEGFVSLPSGATAWG